jgi:uncharacterized protein (DUF433 family)
MFLIDECLTLRLVEVSAPAQDAADVVMPYHQHTAACRARPLAAQDTELMNWIERITFDPTVMGGKPCLRGMRVTVGMVVGLLAAGRSKAEILKAYPYLEGADLRAALAYAAWRSEERELPLAMN